VSISDCAEPLHFYIGLVVCHRIFYLSNLVKRKGWETLQHTAIENVRKPEIMVNKVINMDIFLTKTRGFASEGLY